MARQKTSKKQSRAKAIPALAVSAITALMSHSRWSPVVINICNPMEPKLIYDYNGNMVSDGTNTYTWDKDNRLTGISGSLTASYKYDYLGRRFSKTVTGVTSTHIYEGQNLIAERGTATVDYVFGPGIDEPLAMTSGATSYDYSVNGLGSIAAMTTITGTLSRTYTYDAWGIIAAQTGSIANPFTYTSRESSEVGLMYYRGRYYNPAVGRFVSEDPLRFRKGPDFFAYAVTCQFSPLILQGLNLQSMAVVTIVASVPVVLRLVGEAQT